MGELYGTHQITTIDEMAKSDEIFEAFLIDDILSHSDEEINKFCESAECEVLIEKQVLNKSAATRMSKEGDLKRRIKLCSYLIAKSNNDPLWAKLVKYQKLKKQYSQKIYDKYYAKAVKLAKVSQKEYIKKARTMQASKEEKEAAKLK